MEYTLVVRIASHKICDIVHFASSPYYGRFLVGQIPLLSVRLFFNVIKPLVRASQLPPFSARVTHRLMSATIPRYCRD